jgi:hypothetical protein
MSFPRKRESILPFCFCRGRIPVCVRTRTGKHSTRPYCGLDKSSPYLDRRDACPTFEGVYNTPLVIPCFPMSLRAPFLVRGNPKQGKCYIVYLCHCERPTGAWQSQARRTLYRLLSY